MILLRGMQGCSNICASRNDVSTTSGLMRPSFTADRSSHVELVKL